MHGLGERLRNGPAVAIEERTRKVLPGLHICRIGRPTERDRHLFGDLHQCRPDDFELDGV